MAGAHEITSLILRSAVQKTRQKDSREYLRLIHSRITQNNMAILASTTSEDAKPCYLLALPLEIRLMIYKESLLVQKEGQTPASAIKGRCAENPHVDRKINACLSQYGTHPYIDNYGHYGYASSCILGPSDRGFCALRRANKQLCEETRILLFVPGIALTMRDDLALTLCANSEMKDFLKQAWVKENLSTLRIQLMWDGNPGWPYNGDSLVMMYPSNSVIWGRKICWVLGLGREYWGRDWEFDFRPRGSFNDIARLLAQCPNLKKVEIWPHSESFFETWRDPVGDMLAMQSLVTNGVEVELMTGDGVSSHLGQWKAFERMSKGMSYLGKLRLKVLGKGLRWDHKQTIYERDLAHGGDSMKYLTLTNVKK